MPGLIGKQLIREDHPVDYFVATAGQNSFTLSRAPGAANAILVFVNGVIQRAGSNYSLNGAVLTLNATSGVSAGSTIYVWYAGILSGSAGLAGGISTSQATGSGDAQVASFTPAYSTYFQNMTIEVGAPALSTGTTPTINIDGLGIKRVYDNSGNDPVAGAIGGKHIYIYDTTLNSGSGGFRLINPLVTNSNPVGTVISLLSNTTPSGYLPLDGSLQTRTSYPALWSFAQASGYIVSEATWTASSSGCFSTGDLSTTFRLPNFRGEFLRGYDAGRGIDSGRVQTAVQIDAMQGHLHGPSAGAGAYWESSGSGSIQFPNAGSAVNAFTNTGTPVSDGTNGTPRTAIETRPRNVTVVYYIKY